MNIFNTFSKSLSYIFKITTSLLDRYISILSAGIVSWKLLNINSRTQFSSSKLPISYDRKRQLNCRNSKYLLPSPHINNKIITFYFQDSFFY